MDIHGLFSVGYIFEKIEVVSSPNWTLRKGFEIESSDDPKILAAASESKIEIRVREVVDVGNRTICKNDLWTKAEAISDIVSETI
jgi:hypothetical protein